MENDYVMYKLLRIFLDSASMCLELCDVAS